MSVSRMNCETIAKTETQNTGNKWRIAWVDIVKGIGIFLVVYGHAVQGITNVIAKGGGAVPSWLWVQIDFIWSFHMPLFVFCSGFFAINFTGEPFIKGMLNKTRTLLIPYIIFSVLELGAHMALKDNLNSDLSDQSPLSFLWSPNLEMWFIYALFWMFIIFWMMLKVLNKIRHNKFFDKFLKKFLEKFWGTIVFLISVPLYLFGDQIGKFIHYPIFGTALHYLIYFTLGASTFSFIRNFRAKWWHMLISIIAFTGANALMIANTRFEGITFNGITRSILNFTLALIGIIMVVIVSKLLENVDGKKVAIRKVVGGVIYAGTVTMPIYLIHAYPVQGGRVVFLNVLHFSNYPIIIPIIIIVETILGMLVPIVIYRLIGKTRVGKLLFGGR